MINDYRRGRAAVGYLSGKRRSRGTDRRRASRRWQIALAVGVPAIALAVLVATGASWVGKPATTPLPAAAGQDRANGVVIGPAVVGGAPSFLPAKEIRYASWEEAKTRAGFVLREPGWLPEGYWLSALQSFVPDTGSSADETIDSVVATFTGPDGSYLTVDQFWLAEPAKFDLNKTLPNPPTGVGHGVVQVAGRNALWQAGVATLDAAGSPTGWDSSVTVLTWLDGRTGYRLQANAVDLAGLVRIAGSGR